MKLVHIAAFEEYCAPLRSVKTIAFTGMLIALQTVIEATTQISITPGLKINFAFLGLSSIGLLFGPLAAMLAAIPCDILPAVLHGDSINPLYTVISVIEGLIWGLFLYMPDGVPFLRSPDSKEKKTPVRGLVAGVAVKFALSRAVASVVVNIILNTVVNYILGYAGNSTFGAYLAARTIKNVSLFPIEFVLMAAVLPVIYSAYKLTGHKAG